MMAHDGCRAGDDERVAEQVGRAIGDELRALGFDIDFAPVLDVHTNPANPIIGERAFGTDADDVARRALAFARGLDAAGVLACGKHFPGHGDTDDRLAPRAAARSITTGSGSSGRARCRSRARPRAGLPMIMTAHVVFAALDATRPATLSHAVVTGLLRDKLGYRGVIVSDDLDMKRDRRPHGRRRRRGRRDPRRLRRAAAVPRRGATRRAPRRRSIQRGRARQPTFRARVGEAAARVRAMKRAHAANRRRARRSRATSSAAFEHRRLADRLAGRVVAISGSGGDDRVRLRLREER